MTYLEKAKLIVERIRLARERDNEDDREMLARLNHIMDDEEANEQWRETSPDRLVSAECLDRATGKWEPRRIKDIKAGDIFRMFLPDGLPCSPFDYSVLEHENELIAYATADAKINHITNEGYGVLCEIGAPDDIMRLFNH